MTAQTTQTAFPSNFYGYSLDNTTFHPLPANTSPAEIKATTAPSTDTTSFTLGAKVNNDLASGTYTDTVVFSLVANIIPIPYLQDLTLETCRSFTTGQQYTYADRRDEKLYTISKLADGRCWMTQNLDLGDSTKDTILTPADSDVSTNFTIPASSVQTSGTGSWISNVDTIKIYDNGNTWIEPTSAGNNATVMTTGTPDVSSKYIGNYYNWYAATAGTGTNSVTFGNASSSICPKGWKLPTGGPDGDASKLYGATVGIITRTEDTAKSFTLQSHPTYIIPSGYYDSEPWNRGVIGDFWVRTTIDATIASAFAISPSIVNPVGYSSKAQFGFAVRCVLAQPFDEIEHMQSMTSDTCSRATVNDQKVLWDNRDNKSYVIRKLADGHCWMVQNLRLGGSSAITLTPASTNITSNFTLSASSNTFGTSSNSATANDVNINRMHDNGNTWLSPTVVNSNSTVNTTGTPPSATQYMGNYYNWYTATAGTGTYAMSTNGQNATQSLCPKGWRLPTGGEITTTGNGEILTLYNTYGDNFNNFNTAFAGITSGYWHADRPELQGTRGLWWSSTAYSNIQAYSLHILNTGEIYQPRSDWKMPGYSIRCLAQ